MGKVVKSILAIAVAVVLVVVALPALTTVLATTFAGSAAAGAAALAAGTVAGIAAQVAAGMIVAVVGALASRLIMGKPKSLNNATFGSLNTTVDPTAARKIVFGKRAAGADERFHEKVNSEGQFDAGDDTKGDYLWKVIALASHKMHSVQAVYFEDELCYNGSAVVGKFNKDSGLLIQPTLEGTAANATPCASGTYWTGAARFTGCAYMKLRFKLDPDVFPNGIPTKIATVVEGCPVYDPRRDSTVGGSGSHRWNDQSTWQYYNGTDEIGRNPALALLTYIIGYGIKDPATSTSKLAWGLGINPNRIDLGNFIAYANLCDEPVATKAGGMVKRYQCDVILSTADSHDTNINLITATMGTAKMVDTNGLYQLVGGYDDLDGPIVTFTVDDLIGQYQYTPSNASTKERYNIARGRFTNPDKLYQIEDWGQIEIDPLADGIPRPLVLELGGVTRAETCQRIAKQMLVRNAYTGTLTGIFGPRAFSVQVGSLVRLVIPRMGWAEPGKLFRVMDQSENVDLIFQMTLQEEDSQVYAWDENEAVDLPPDVRPPAWNPEDVVLVENLSVSSRTISNTTGGSQSLINVAWTAPDAGVTSIQIEVMEEGGSDWQTATDRFSPKAESFTFSAIAGGIGHLVRARYRMYSGIYGPWTEATTTAQEDSNTSKISGYLTDESVTFAADSEGNIL